MRIKKIIPFLFLMLIPTICFASYGDKKIYIWDGVKADGVYKSVTPMYLFNAKDGNGNPSTNKKNPAVIICPGGSYHHHGMYNEGKDVATWFQSKGFTAFVLKYRINGGVYKYPAMMEDLQRAIQLVRENADEYNVDSNNIGLIGFSAGGHLVAWQGEFYGRINLLEKMNIKTNVDLKPNWVAPIYPVVSMQDDIYHHWSRWSLFSTDSPSKEQKDLLSLELQVPDQMCPVYLVACHDDPVVKFENSKRLSLAMKDKNIDITFVEYEKGGHGFGMMDCKFVKETCWNEKLFDWLTEKGFAK